MTKDVRSNDWHPPHLFATYKKLIKVSCKSLDNCYTNLSKHFPFQCIKQKEKKKKINKQHDKHDVQLWCYFIINLCWIMIITGSVQLGVNVYTVWPYFHPEVQLDPKLSDLPCNRVEDQHMSSSQKHWPPSNGQLKLKLVVDSSGPPTETLPLLSDMGSVKQPACQAQPLHTPDHVQSSVTRNLMHVVFTAL